MKSALRAFLILVQLPSALMVLYLDLLTAAAALWKGELRTVPPSARFALLVPAYDEELLLPRLLASCRALDYPQDLFAIHVVADNCSDRTAAVARTAGATAHERTDAQHRGKGYALRWLIARLADQSLMYDAYVIVDADSVVSPNLLSVFNAHLARGDQAIQCYYGVLNRNQSWPATLRYVAFELYNGLRPRGRAVLGLSAGLRGNGMCFAAPVIERFSWGAFGLAEDAEFHLELIAAGIRVTYAALASVVAEMPTSLRQAQSQNVRWDRGRLHLVRTHGFRLLADAIRLRDPVRLDALAELLLPPLSVLAALAAGCFALSATLRAHGARRLAGLVVCGLIGYVAGGLRMARAAPRTYVALIMAPLYVVWKIAVYLLAALGRRDGRWVRTERRG